MLLGIETSCDETAVALYHPEKGLIAHEVYSQACHANYGGVVPELAARDHVRKLLPMLRYLLEGHAVFPTKLSGIAYTAGPGLVGALLVGATLAHTLGYVWQVPVLPIHHLEGHLLAPFLDNSELSFPFLLLLVSGGHTLLAEIQELGRYRLLGETLDDAAGEAFDKTAKLLGLSYPGGAELSQLAKQGKPGRFTFPRPMIQPIFSLDFSFSGLKTAVFQCIQSHESLTHQDRADIAQAFEEAVVDTLVIKCQRALRASGLRTLVVAGGVAANQPLRIALMKMMSQEFQNDSDFPARVYYPNIHFCTDNAAMIAYAGYLRQRVGLTRSSLAISVYPRWPLFETF